MYQIQGNKGNYEVVIGLEVHAQVISQAKLFSGASTNFGAKPNTQVSIIDAAMPGMLPVINHECVWQAVRTGIAMGSQINKKSVFSRKNYFYADLPQGYQISQYDQPIVGEGFLMIKGEDGNPKKIGIERLHLEQDAGKSMHDQHPTKSYIDLNRAGVALMEIVSKPDIRSPEEAADYVAKLRNLLKTIGSCDGNMQEGSLRADVNVSVRLPGEEYGTRVELKNINSLKFIRQAIEVEAKRQVGLIESGEKIIQQTRLFDPNKGETRAMRTKEEANDYRYFPDPDLLPLVLDDDFIARARQSLPELPDAKRARYQADFGLSTDDAAQLVSEPEFTQYFESALPFLAKPQSARVFCNWMLAELFGRLNKLGVSLNDAKTTPAQLAQLVNAIDDGKINGKQAKEIFDEMMQNGADPDKIIAQKSISQITDESAIFTMINDIIRQNPNQVAQYKGGQDKLLGWFVGQLMKASAGSVNPTLANEYMKKALNDL